MIKRRFHVTGSCVPQRHYMVRLNDRLKRIKEDLVSGTRVVHMQIY